MYVGNGASGKSYNQTVDFNKATRLKGNKFKRDGYTFVGWSKSPNGEVVLKNKSKAKKLTNKAKIKLYAIWRSDNDPNGRVQRQALLYADSSEIRFVLDIYQMQKVYESADFDGGKIRTNLYAKMNDAEIQSIIKKAGQNTTKNDVTYLHFSCHGIAWDGDLYVTNDSKVTPEEMRVWLDEYVDGTVVITLASCYSGEFQKRMVELDNTENPDFITRFIAAGTGAVSAKKYKILTASGDGESIGYRYGLDHCVLYWSSGMGFDSNGKQTVVYADTTESDSKGYRGYGNYDGKVTLSELYNYAKIPIYDGIESYRRYQEGDPYVKKEDYITVSYPQVFPENDNFVIYQ